MEQEQPNYYAIIPAEVRYCKDIAPNEKLLYGEITALCNKTGQCYATNNYFAKLYNVEIETVSRWISHLIKYGFISSEIDIKSGNKRYLQLNQYLLIKKSIPIDKKIKENNINNNNIYNKKEKEDDIDAILNTQPNELIVNLKEFLKMRKAIKKPMTTLAFKMLVNKLNKLSQDIDIQNKILEQSILHCWQDVYKLKDCDVSRETIKQNYENRDYSGQDLNKLFDDLSEVEL